MMPADAVIRAGLSGGCVHGCLAAAKGAVAGGTAQGADGNRGLGLATLVTWLAAEVLGAYMLRNWFASGGARQRRVRPDGASMPVLLSHAGLALAGLVCWVSFLVSSAAAPAWLAIGFLAPAIGLGVSTVTVWTPYPARRQPAARAPDDSRAGGTGTVVTDEMLHRALANEALTSKLVDDLVERMLTEPAPPRPASRKWQLAPVIPILHGVLAITTFLLAMLAAIATVTGA